MKKWQPWILTGIRVFLGLIFFIAGMAKLYKGAFPGIIGPVWLEERLAEYDKLKFLLFPHATPIPEVPVKRNLRWDLIWAAGLVMVFLSVQCFGLGRKTLAYSLVGLGLLCMVGGEWVNVENQD